MTRIEELKKHLRNKTAAGIALAFSGGVDSSFLLAVLKELCDKTPFPLQALTMRTVFQREDELTEARQIAASCGVELAEFSCDPLSGFIDSSLHPGRLEDVDPPLSVMFYSYFYAHYPLNLISAHLVVEMRPVGDLEWNTSPSMSYTSPFHTMRSPACISAS